MVQRYRRMVALGSSFAAGPGLKPVADAAASRSEVNYAHLVAAALGAELADVTVSGATTDTILRTPQRMLFKRFPPQIQAVDSATDLVTFTAGGNDIGYLGSVLKTGMVNRLKSEGVLAPVLRRMLPNVKLVLPSPADVDKLTRNIMEVVKAARRRAPGATVLLVDYLPIFTGTSADSALGSFSAKQIEHFRQLAGLLTEAYVEAGRASRAGVIAASEFGSTAGQPTGERLIKPLGWGSLRALGPSFHPTAAGMRLVADTIIENLRRTL